MSPAPDARQGWLDVWLLRLRKLLAYSIVHPEVINHVAPKARVFLLDRVEETQPEPDVAAYKDYPIDLPVADMDWRDVSPVLVAEVLSPGDPAKDLERNVGLYLQVPSIREYRVLDSREDADHPALWVYRRRGDRWQRPIEVGGGQTYATKLLPGFAGILDVHRLN